MENTCVTEAKVAIEEATKAIWLEQPEEIRRMLQRNVEINKNFSVWTSCNGRVESLNASLYSYYVQIEKGEAELSFWKRLLSAEMKNYGQIMDSFYYMGETARLLKLCAQAYECVENREQLLSLTESLLFYSAQIAYWVDMSIPWDAVSDAFAQIMKEQKKVQK